MSATIVRIGARGDGVTAEGRHSPLAAPGDLLADDGSLVPGPHHVAPPCRHFPKCGGCQLQHVDDAAYCAYLTDRIVSALAQQRIEVREMRPPHLSPPRTRRRATLHAERIGRKIILGFNEGKSHRIVDMRECHILLPELFAMVDPLRALLSPMLKPRRQASVGLTLTDQGIDVALEGVTADGLEAQEKLIAFCQTNRIARLSIDEGYGSEARWEPEPATVTLGGVPVALPVNAFLQATSDGEAALVAGVAEAVGDAATIADLFAGLGTFALPLARSAKVLAVEGARDAALALKAAANRLRNSVAVEHRDLFRRPLDPGELNRFDAIVLDPPRAGAKEQTQTLASCSAKRIAYVSCSPSTFARDARTLIEGGWRLDWIRPVGQFRWSTHVELVSAFSR